MVSMGPKQKSNAIKVLVKAEDEIAAMRGMVLQYEPSKISLMQTFSLPIVNFLLDQFKYGSSIEEGKEFNQSRCSED